MMRRPLLKIALLLLLTVAFMLHSEVHAASPRIIYVDEKWPGPWYGTIQNPYQNITSGLTEALNGDTIFVYNGTYYEQLSITKSVTLQGQDKNLTVIDANQTGDAITIEADNVNVTGFTVRNGGPTSSGVSILGSTGNDISQNVIEGNYNGIRLLDSNGNTLADNDVSNNYYGISLSASNSNSITQNTVSSNEDTGIRISDSNNVTVADNSITRSTFGVALLASDNNTFADNNVSQDTDGFYVFASSNNVFFNNSAFSNTQSGIRLIQSTNNFVNNNTFSNDLTGILIDNSTTNALTNNNLLANSQFGIDSEYSDSNIIAGNTISENVVRAILLFYSNNNTIFHNSIGDGARTLASVNSTNHLDNGLEGNYWSNYKGTDEDQDGIGDTPYVIDKDNQDNYPLMGAFTDFLVPYQQKTYHVPVISNSTISQFQFNETIKMLTFNVTNNNNAGFCRIDIPQELSGRPYAVLLDDKKANTTVLPTSNSSNTLLYFVYNQSVQEIKILSEPYYELLNDYEILLENFRKLNSTFYQMNQTYINQSQSFLELYNSLNQTYQKTLANYVQLSNNFETLNQTYQEANSTYYNLLTQFNSLSLTYSKTESEYANTRLALVMVSIAAVATIITTSSAAVRYHRESRRQETLAEKYRSELERISLSEVARRQFEADVQRRKGKIEDFQSKYGIEVRPRDTLEDVIKNLELKKKRED
ncbi:MAG: NosD domain-containing protein [Candidatus Bathyarchaeia archaeon]